MKPRSRKLMTSAVIAIMMAVFWYGLIRFRDSPISLRKDGTYRGKFNHLHTKEDFEEFNTWETANNVVFPGGMIAVLLLNREEFLKQSASRAAR